MDPLRLPLAVFSGVAPHDVVPDAVSTLEVGVGAVEIDVHPAGEALLSHGGSGDETEREAADGSRRELHGEDGRVLPETLPGRDEQSPHGVHPERAPEEGVRQISHVTAAVDEHAAPRALGGALPVPGGLEAGELVGEPANRAESQPSEGTLPQTFEGDPEEEIAPQGVADEEPAAARRRALQHGVTLLDATGHRFLANHVLARPQGRHRLLGVQVMRGEDEDQVDVVRVDDLPRVRGGPLETESPAQRLGPAGRRVVDRDERHAAGGEKSPDVALRDIAGAEETDSEAAHGPIVGH